MAQGFQLDGRIHLINDIQTFDSGFSKREFVVETGDQYPQMVKFELIKERTSLVDNFNQGDNVTVHFDIRGNEYNGKYYVNLNCWRLDGPGGPGGPPPQQQQPQQGFPQQQPQGGGGQQVVDREPPGGFENDDDIPF